MKILYLKKSEYLVLQFLTINLWKSYFTIIWILNIDILNSEIVKDVFENNLNILIKNV